MEYLFQRGFNLYELLSLSVTQNVLQLPFLFSFSLFPSAVFGKIDKSFLSKFRQLLFWTCVTKIGSLSLNTPTNYCVYVLKFCMREHGMSCALEINSNGGSKRGHVESCSSTTTNIISQLPQCLWPPNVAGWWLTIRGSHPKNYVTLWSRGLAKSDGKLKPL